MHIFFGRFIDGMTLSIDGGTGVHILATTRYGLLSCGMVRKLESGDHVGTVTGEYRFNDEPFDGVTHVMKKAYIGIYEEDTENLTYNIIDCRQTVKFCIDGLNDVFKCIPDKIYVQVLPNMTASHD
jgi:hypothetical protein